ncbi:alpha/beta fold hydrolase [Actinopolymorpha sp. B11F2]|uniref:alpha/beta fold hydrolase n=1 Tax=Actinopolymorpha sp. B11F2 TaxID=3160862 RepID=UPI0032E4A55C
MVARRRRIHTTALVIVISTAVTGLGLSLFLPAGESPASTPVSNTVVSNTAVSNTAVSKTVITNAVVTVLSGPRRDRPVRLDTRLYVPRAASPDDPAPAILLAHGLGGTKTSVEDQALDLADEGYVVLTWTARGFGRSGGHIHLNSPDHEVADARALLDLLAERPEVRRDSPGDPRVGVIGSSYGGALALLLAGHDQRVDAVVPQSTWNDLGRSLFPESTGKGPEAGVFKRAWAGWLYASGLGDRGSLPQLAPDLGEDQSTDSGGLASTMPNGASGPNGPQGADGANGPDGANGAGASRVFRTTGGATPAADGSAGCGRFAPTVCRMYQRAALTGRADPATIRLLDKSSPAGVLDRITAPTLLVQGTQDTLFPLAEADANLAGIRANGTPICAMWYSGGHDAGAGSDVDRWRVRMATLVWLDHYLGAADQHDAGPPPVRPFAFTRITGVDDESGSVRALGLLAPSAYPGLAGDLPARVVRLRGGPGQISNPPAGTPAAMSSVPGLGAVAGRLLTRVTLDVPGQAVSYDSGPLTGPVDVTGSPTVRVRAASRSGDAVLFVKVYDVAPNGLTELPGGAVAPVRLHNLPASLDQARPVDVTLPGVVHRFQPGHRIRVTVATADQAYAGPAEPQTYVVGLAGNSIRLPQVRATTSGMTAGPWLDAAMALAAALSVTAAALWLLARRRTRRRASRVCSVHADTPLVVRGVSKKYGNNRYALRDVDFTVGRGEVVGLLGPNGAGKTTCLRILAGLIRPSGGRVLVFGRDVVPGASVLSRTGLLVEGPGFLPHLSGRANLELFWDATGLPREQAKFDDVLEIAGLGAAVDRKVREYSHGMKQRLGIAQAMLGMPDLLILDEPTDGLDPPQIAALRRVLQTYAEGGRSVLVSSHLLAEVEQTCTHVVVLHLGRLQAAGPVADIVGGAASVVVDVTDVSRAETLLAGLEVGAVARHNGGLVVDLDGVPRTRLVRTLVTGGVDVSRVAPREKLEDVFLGLVAQHPEQRAAHVPDEESGDQSAGVAAPGRDGTGGPPC